MVCYTYKGFDSFEEAKLYAKELREKLVILHRTNKEDNHGIEKPWTVRSEKLYWDNKY